MAITTPGIVRIRKPATASYGEAMSQFRMWLDSNKIQPVSFKPAVLEGRAGFEVTFRNEDEALRFDQHFGK
jgi:hypothetical protein